MKLIRLLLVAVFAVMTLTSLPSCTATGGSIDWNSPAIQSEITFIQNIANAFIQNWIKSQLGGVRHLRASHLSITAPQIQSGIDTVTSEVLQQRPTASPALVKAVVTAQFAKQLN
jgi:hypothetical protein